jgi:hypothetical protein
MCAGEYLGGANTAGWGGTDDEQVIQENPAPFVERVEWL